MARVKVHRERCISRTWISFLLTEDLFCERVPIPFEGALIEESIAKTESLIIPSSGWKGCLFE